MYVHIDVIIEGAGFNLVALYLYTTGHLCTVDGEYYTISLPPTVITVYGKIIFH